ncbi:aromatic amino acid transaminase [Roseicyclus mahoneyensis]|uniref:Aminotransferase n=1 Tax=Roseicyclus mahoneyensis TaxID=164332 RepID=A0A316GHN6_9RHOB|nr:amino acid aminotransferase [Roseicyclus mahoneyensis]PWK60091.1 aromatic amino acid aminotransferase [Roseicyclus mahoneyensis]
MFETVTPPEPDKIIRLMGMFAADPRPDKVDLGVGVYRSPDGRTPVMAAVKAAERGIWERQETKGYVSLSGDPGYLDAMRRLILGDAVPAARVAACGTPGGTGAVRQVLETVRRLRPEATVWISDPTWPNHPAIIDHLGQARRTYRYYDPETGGLDRDGMLADLAEAKAGDLILLHGCCHNPTGADLTRADWQAVADLCARTGAIPFVDTAYQGFGDGIEADAAGVRLLAATLPEVLIAASCSKNFGLYRERVGAVLIMTDAKAAADGVLAGMNRQNYAFPPDHGARVVQDILSDAGLEAQWRAELDEMRTVMQGNRAALAAALREATGSDRFGYLGAHRGMFSLIGARPEQVDILRETHGIYLVGDGRMNVAGLTPGVIPRVARALAEVLA